MLTETGNPRYNVSFGKMADAADEALQSYATWEWKTFCRESNETVESPSQNAVWGSCKTGFGDNFDSITQAPKNQEVYARAYAQAVAGELMTMKFNTSSGILNLDLKIDTNITEPTEVYGSSDFTFPNGGIVLVSPSSVTFSWTRSDPNYFYFYSTPSIPQGEKVSIAIIPAPTSSPGSREAIDNFYRGKESAKAYTFGIENGNLANFV